MNENSISPGRECGTCTLCCKLFEIRELEKPKGEWCRHCDVGRGCAIYDQRPTPCRVFYCGYLSWPHVGDHWYPKHSNMVLLFQGGVLAIEVDPDHPDSWRNEPYYSDIKRWAILAAQRSNRVVVIIGRRAVVILPDRDIDMGVVADDEHIIIEDRPGPQGRRLEPRKVKKVA